MINKENTSITSMKLGDTDIVRVYKGETLIYGSQSDSES